jgi:hypothetical protein
MPSIDRFDAAEKLLKQNRERIEKLHPGKYWLIDVSNLSSAIGTNFDDAYAQYEKQCGPITPDGWSFLGQQLGTQPA